MIYIALLLALAITIFFYRNSKPEISRLRKFLLGTLRFTAIAVVLMLLINPVISYEKHLKEKKKQVILLDDSDSMNENSIDSNKFDLARSYAHELRENLEAKNYNAIVYNFSSEIEGDGNSSRLSTTINQLQQKDILQSTDSIFLISDGWLDDSNPDFLNDIQIPVNTLNYDFEATGFDLEISKLQYNQKAWLKEITSLIVESSAENYAGSGNINFFLNDKLIESKELNFSESRYHQSVFDYEFKDTGFQEFHFTITSDSLGEINEANNIFPGAIQVQPDKSSIKIISDNMSWEGRYLIQSILKNERFEADYLLKNNRLLKKNIQVNLSSEIENTKVLCLINNGNLHFNNAEANLIVSFTEQGGGILWFGQPISELSDILPAKKSQINRTFEGQFLLTDAAKSYQTFDIMSSNIDEIPPVRFKYTSPLAGSVVLAEFEEEQNPPAIIFQEVKLGKVLQFSFLDIYKWQLWGKDDHYLTYTNQVLQWLSSPISESFYAWTTQNSYLLGDNIEITLTALDEKYAPVTDLKAEISIEYDNSSYIEDFMVRNNEIYTYSITAEKPGKYNAVIKSGEKSTSTEFVVNPSSSESRDRGINKSLLSFIANKTNGNFYSVDELLDSVPQAEELVITKKYEIPIYKKWYTIALFLLVFSVEIFLRKRWGLL